MKALIKIEKVSNGYILDVNNVKSVAKDSNAIKEQIGELFKNFVDNEGGKINNYTLELACKYDTNG